MSAPLPAGSFQVPVRMSEPGDDDEDGPIGVYETISDESADQVDKRMQARDKWSVSCKQWCKRRARQLIDCCCFGCWITIADIIQEAYLGPA